MINIEVSDFRSLGLFSTQNSFEETQMYLSTNFSDISKKKKK